MDIQSCNVYLWKTLAIPQEKHNNKIKRRGGVAGVFFLSNFHDISFVMGRSSLHNKLMLSLFFFFIFLFFWI